MSVIDIRVTSEYIAEQSDPHASQYVFAYHIEITNNGSLAAQLHSRHWIITDANNKVQEVQGLGVVGEQPTIQPGEVYAYTSGAVLETSTGMMTGSYTMIDDSGRFEAEIPPFMLAQPGTMH